MRTFTTIGLLTCVALAGARPGFAQTSDIPRPFVEGALMVERQPTESFYGTETGSGGRVAIGARFSERHSFRFELDYPSWRVDDRTWTGLSWCAKESDCLIKEAYFPSRTTEHTSVRTVSYSFLYAVHLPRIDRVQVALVAGGSIEQNDRKSSQKWDELGANGEVLRHHESYLAYTRNWPAGVIGVDADVRVTSHLSITPQFRFHTFPYPPVSIIRPGIAMRWTF